MLNIAPAMPETDTAHPLELSVVIPVYNEEDNVAPMIERVLFGLKDFDKPWELILVNDGSTDATLRNARAQLDRSDLDLKIVDLQRNFGQSSAMQAGIDLAQGRLIATLDGDLQNDPADIPMMINELESRDLDLLSGWRKSRQDGLVLRLVPSWIANRLIGRVTGVKIHDYGCSLKIYRGEIIKQVRILGNMHRFIPAWVASVVPQSRIGEVVVSHQARQHGVSKYGIGRTFRVILDLLAVLFFMRYRARPGHFFGSIGLAMGGLSALIFLWLFVVKFGFGEDIGTRPLLMIGVMLFLGSIQSITTGILAEIMLRSTQPGSASVGYVARAVFKKDA